jgi:beta-mannanase
VPDRRATIADLEEQIGRPFVLDHVYHNWNGEFPGEYDRWTIDRGRTLFLSWTTRQTGEPTAKWAAVAAGTYDELIDQRAAAVRDLGVPVLMSFDHEPGAQVGSGAADSGSPSEYRDAWRHVVERFRAAGADNVSWVWTLTAYTFRESDPSPLYPGDKVIDWVGVDGYTNIDCPWLDVPWRSWEEIFGKANDFAAAHGKPLVIAEFSAREDPADPRRKADWLRQAVAATASLSQLKALVSFNSTQDCSSVIATSPEAVGAYRDIASSPAFAATVGDAGSPP